MLASLSTTAAAQTWIGYARSADHDDRYAAYDGEDAVDDDGEDDDDAGEEDDDDEDDWSRSR